MWCRSVTSLLCFWLDMVTQTLLILTRKYPFNWWFAVVDRNDCSLSFCDSWTAFVEQRHTGQNSWAHHSSRRIWSWSGRLSGIGIVSKCGLILMLFSQVFDDYSKLDKVLAVFYEALRMFRERWIYFPLSFLIKKNYFRIASAHILIREATEDTVLEIPKPHGQVGTVTIPIPRGLQVN